MRLFFLRRTLHYDNQNKKRERKGKKAKSRVARILPGNPVVYFASYSVENGTKWLWPHKPNRYAVGLCVQQEEPQATFERKATNVSVNVSLKPLPINTI